MSSNYQLVYNDMIDVLETHRLDMKSCNSNDPNILVLDDIMEKCHEGFYSNKSTELSRLAVAMLVVSKVHNNYPAARDKINELYKSGDITKEESVKRLMNLSNLVSVLSDTVDTMDESCKKYKVPVASIELAINTLTRKSNKRTTTKSKKNKRRKK